MNSIIFAWGSIVQCMSLFGISFASRTSHLRQRPVKFVQDCLHGWGQLPRQKQPRQKQKGSARNRRQNFCLEAFCKAQKGAVATLDSWLPRQHSHKGTAPQRRRRCFCSFALAILATCSIGAFAEAPGCCLSLWLSRQNAQSR